MWLWIALGVGVLALVAALLLATSVIAADTGTADMQVISNAIREGAEAFLRRQYKTIGAIAVVLAVAAFCWVSAFAEDCAVCDEDGAEFSDRGGVFGAGRVHGNVLLDTGEHPDGFGGANEFESGAPDGSAGRSGDGVVVVALSLLGVGVLFLFFGGLEHPEAVPLQLVGFGFGASLVALFAQLGGGIYTKAADVGADLVGKVEAGIPEDDPRNPAVIADLVGDNVGDCAGRGADFSNRLRRRMSGR